MAMLQAPRFEPGRFFIQQVGWRVSSGWKPLAPIMCRILASKPTPIRPLGSPGKRKRLPPWEREAPSQAQGRPLRGIRKLRKASLRPEEREPRRLHVDGQGCCGPRGGVVGRDSSGQGKPPLPGWETGAIRVSGGGCDYSAPLPGTVSVLALFASSGSVAGSGSGWSAVPGSS